MTTDCNATTTATRPGAACGSSARPAPGTGDVGAWAKQAATRARKATDLTAVVASWNRPLIRTPAHCSSAKKTSTPTAIGFTAGAQDGIRTAKNSPIAMVTYPRTAPYVIQSDQPTAKPTASPKARRA